KCMQDAIMKCEDDADGCAVWKTFKKCSDGKFCDPASLKCVEECSEKCDPEALKKCTDKGIEICEPDDNGCAVYRVETCGSGQHCDEEKLKCVSSSPDLSSCDEVCNPDASKRCTDKGVETCSSDDDGCAVWKLTETCSGQQVCDETSMKCLGECESVCTKDDKKCTDEGVAECQDSNADGCFEWNVITPCQEGQVCDEASLSCKCSQNQCSAGDVRCENNRMQECAAGNDGCLNWIDKDPCGPAKACNSDKTSCEYTCGDDCEPFSVILIPDPQNYTKDSEKENNIYTREMKWIRDNQKKENIRAAIHLGDITDNDTTEQWEVAAYAQNVLDQANIPYSIATGNHDYAQSNLTRADSKFGKYFGPDHFKGKSWYHASPYVGNSYITFDVGNIKFMVIALEFAARKDVICWADELIKKHPDYHVIIETHNYLRDDSGKKGHEDTYALGGYLPHMYLGASGWDLFQELVARHSNVFLAVGGHEFDVEFRQKKGFNQNTVSEMLVNYQVEAPCIGKDKSQCCHSSKNAGNGWLRQLVFDPKTNKIHAKTITVLKDSEFLDGIPMMYCSKINNQNYNFCGKSDPNILKAYDQYPTEKDHLFDFDADFATPVDYKYSTNDYLGFGVREINSVSAGDQVNSAIAMHRTTGMMVTVWEDNSSTEDGKQPDGTRNLDIMGRVFYGGGCQKVAQFAVNTDTKGDQKTPDTAMDKNGNFVVVWADDTDGDGKYEIFARGFNEQGAERIKTFRVNKAGGHHILPSVAMTPDGRFFVAWENRSGSSERGQIYVRGFDASGKQLFAERNLETPEGNRNNPDIAVADDGKFAVTWEDDTDLNGVYEIHAKGFNADGTDRFETMTVNSLDYRDQLEPSISMNESGTFFITYKDNSADASKYQIKLRGYKADGSKLTEDMVVSGSDGAKEPDVCVDKSGNAVVTWTATNVPDVAGEWWSSLCKYYGGTSCENDIMFRMFTDGKLQDRIKSFTPIRNGNQEQPAIACTQGGAFTILWSDDNDRNNVFEILGRGYDKKEMPNPKCNL
ncbi:MAG: metallophosphoesterase, partial [Proteobacteria bacterium]|nr:metallophosphoesterase [Pseudomonadota bacterium]